MSEREQVAVGRKYAFSWERLGDLREGRPNLGPTARVEAYRLFQFTLRDRIETAFGADAADGLFRAAGRIAGAEFLTRVIGPCEDLSGLLAKLPSILESFGLGILRIECCDEAIGRLVFTVAEDLDCSGLPECGFSVCTYDEGFFEGLFERALGVEFKVVEKDCWCSGAKICRFEMTAT